MRGSRVVVFHGTCDPNGSRQQQQQLLLPPPLTTATTLKSNSSLAAKMAAEVPWMVHALSLGTPAGLALTYYDGSLFSYHVAAMSFTFLFLLPQGLFLAAASFKMGALALAVAGISAMFCHRHRLHKPHFNTAHARLAQQPHHAASAAHVKSAPRVAPPACLPTGGPGGQPA
eukprot:jgi/Mesen1/7795/ME000408S06917